MRTLIISHNSLCTYENMGKTMLSLFSQFTGNELCQLFFYNQYPDTRKASSYFRITDIDAIHLALKMKNDSGIVEPKMDVHNYSFDKYGIYQKENNKSAYKVLVRDMIWRFSKWETKELLTWLRNQKIDNIFVAPGRYKFIYRIASRLSKILSVPIYAYICDDYYFTLNDTNIISRFEIGIFKRTVYNFLGKCDNIFVINDDLNKLYSNKFKRPTITVYTESEFDVISGVDEGLDRIERLTYLGNLNYNRFKSLIDIAEALEIVNEKFKENYYLEIYSNEKNQEILAELEKKNTIRFRGFVSGDEFKNILLNTKILVHVEAFDSSSKASVKYSMSTKIADALACGKILFAYGPKDVSSIKYLKNNNCAYVVTEKDKLVNSLTNILTQEGDKKAVLRNAYKIAINNHKKGISSNKIKNILCIRG